MARKSVKGKKENEITEQEELNAAQYENIIDYAKNENRGFDELPFNEIDALIFSVLSYCRFEDDVSSPDSKGRWVRLGSFADENMVTAVTYNIAARESKGRLLAQTAANPRFADVKLNYFAHTTDSLMEKQFSAVSFLLPDRTVFIAFRGTDNTLTGWRENLNMAYLNSVPAQKAAVDYFTRVAELCKSRRPWKKIRGYRIGGHSKGGNLSVYAAVNCQEKLRKRVLDVYSFDGPGFKKNIFESYAYRAIYERVHLYLPQDSMIGTLLTQSRDYIVVSSASQGFAEHDPFSWRISGGSFVKEDDLSPKAKLFDDVLDNWMDKLDDVKRSLLVRTIFEMIDSTNAQSFSDVIDMVQHRDWNALKVLKNVPADERKDLISIIMELFRSYRTLNREAKEAAETAQTGKK